MVAQRKHTLLTLLMSVTCVAQAQPPAELPEAEGSTIGYPTVQAALEALRAKPGVKFRTENGWLIAQDDEALAVYMFIPMDHPAYPTVIKRSVFNRDGKGYIGTDVRCEASKSICDDLMRQL
jgi:hypothetical protein